MQELLSRRRAEMRAAAQEIAAWKKRADKGRATLAAFNALFQDVLEFCFHHREDDEKLLRSLMRLAGNYSSKTQVDEVNRKLQIYLDARIDFLRELLACTALRPNLLSKYDAARLEGASADYQQWKDEIPDLLFLWFRPVTDMMRNRMSEALKVTGQSDWRSLCEDHQS